MPHLSLQDFGMWGRIGEEKEAISSQDGKEEEGVGEGRKGEMGEEADEEREATRCEEERKRGEAT